MIYWFSVDPEQPDVLDVGIRNGLWGVEDGAREEIDPLDPGDFILFFHRDDGFVLCEVESEPYTESVPVWSDVDYPHRVRISEPLATDRYAHLAEVHECLRDPDTGEPFASAAKAADALERASGGFRPLADEEVRCLVGRLGWSLPSDVAPPPAAAEETTGAEEPAGTEGPEPDEAAEPAEEATGSEEPDREPEEERGPAVAEPVAGEPGDEEPDAGGEAEDEDGEPPAEQESAAAAGDEAPPDDAAEEEAAGAAGREASGPAVGDEAAEREEQDEAGPEEPSAAATEEGAGAAGREASGPAADAHERAADAEASDRPGPRVILAPAAGNETSRLRWKQTVEEGVPIDRLRDRLPDEEIETLRRGSSADRVRVWGVAPSRDERSRGRWEAAGPGDVLLFTGGGEIFASARVLATRRDEGLAEELWGRSDDGDTWEFLFFATEPARQGVSYEEFNEVAGYEAGYRIPRLNVLGDERSLRILGTFPEFGLGPSSEAAEPPDDARSAGTAQPGAGAGDGKKPPEPGPSAATPSAGGPGATDRARLRTLLFGRRELGRCALCGRLLPVDLLAVVYVKPLEACTPEELEDVGNDVLPGCRLGCAGLFREGFVVVEEGVVRPGRGEPLTDPVEERVEELAGHRCEYWHSGSEPYFRWHAAEHGGGEDA